MRVLFIIDPLDRLALAGDTSYALMLECAARGWDVWTCQLEHLGLAHDDAIADAAPTIVTPATTPAEAFQLEARVGKRLADFDVVLMRKDPPVDVAYLHATWILEHARGKTLLVNDPRGLRELNEHLAVLRFPELTPPTIVTRSIERLRAFQREQGGTIVVKPVDGFGGLGIFVVRDGDGNASSILETSTGAGTRWTIAQRYLPEVVEGDKRVVAGRRRADRRRAARSCQRRGARQSSRRWSRGQGAPRCARSRDRRVRSHRRCASYGQVFVGLDIIGGMLTELNITSPTGIRHIARLEDRNVAAPVIEAFERLARARRA